ncbi:MAG TPA: FKBP-type peptidyl-prolyl cis-trans isomerase [Usitatibacter sp.]|nr:FKBP-type peptidyl-prolyl cis-trans isomerase [Usitatibacter sp.]
MKRHMGIAIAAAAFAASCSTSESRAPASDYAAAPAAAKAAPARTNIACEPAPKELVTTDLKVGDGRTAVPLASALVFYTGWVYDPCAPDHKGFQFDSNADKRAPFGFRIGAGRVIKGWDEGVAGMKEGGKRLLVIPANKAYGERAIEGRIPANSALVFEVNLVQLTFQDQPPSNPPPPKQ